MKITIESTRAFVEHDQRIESLLTFLSRTRLAICDGSVKNAIDGSTLLRADEATTELITERNRLISNFINQFLSADTGVLK